MNTKIINFKNSKFYRNLGIVLISVFSLGIFSWMIFTKQILEIHFVFLLTPGFLLYFLRYKWEQNYPYVIITDDIMIFNLSPAFSKSISKNEYFTIEYEKDKLRIKTDIKTINLSLLYIEENQIQFFKDSISEFKSKHEEYALTVKTKKQFST